ncbi:FecR family protein [Dinghuibacter silviterrae]|uniref:FecR family protein n=2 Tax=Dinghuibacter silviterrae TaxID=1539049 RepID=A0A4V3GKY4_9BACT|nr:FecR family protein [Dinghuibacter silviterrae]
MENSRIIELLAKKLGKSATPDELQELGRLLGEHPEYSYLEEVVQSLKGSREHVELHLPAQEVTDMGWKHLAGRLNEPKVRRLWPRWVAAAMVLLMAGAAWLFQVRKSPVQASKSVNVGYGARRMLTLSDGTRIWLNAGSRLIYPERFTGSKREVTVEGEAFFDVAPQASMPFLVHAGKLTIKVLGTSFDVKDYKEDADITTTLISGKVEVMMDNNPERDVILEPREKLVVAKVDTALKSDQPQVRYQVRSVMTGVKNNIAETAWINNKLVFNDDTFEEVARQLERKYNVQVNIADEGLKDEHVSGVFDKETLQQVLDILRATTRFDYRVEGQKIVIWKN